MNLPKSLIKVAESFERLPGIGPKTAQRLAFYLIRVPKDEVLKFSDSLRELKEKTLVCEKCFNLSDDMLCEVCKNSFREEQTICVVETPLDLIAIDKTGYKGLYHVLHGVIDPLNAIGPNEIFIPQFFTRVGENISVINEIILALGTSLESESTCTYIYKELRRQFGVDLKISRIGKGLPVGTDVEYADESTLSDALIGRLNYN